MNLQSTIIPDTDNQININSVFSSLDKPMITKDFKGGKISNVFASTELDLSNADLSGLVVLNISQLFGEITLTVPSDWHVEVDISQLFSTVDDYRENRYGTRNSDKVLTLKGTSVFANIEIHNNI
jgi:predicted membrane protein